MSSQIVLDENTFANIVQHAPLVSIDLCVVRDNELLMCMRNNEPAKGFLFTPGGRIFKGECWSAALNRIATTEIGLPTWDLNPILMGVWDHFYENSVFGSHVSTHYVNLPHFLEINSSFSPQLDGQHSRCYWVNLAQATKNKLIHPYVLKYVAWILEK
jgi:colanic acid biosynthesis protein WcaH